MLGDGQGVIMTGDGEMVSWNGQGVGRFTGHGTAGVLARGRVLRTASQRLARLNGVAGVFEFETDESGKSEALTWEWK